MHGSRPGRGACNCFVEKRLSLCAAWARFRVVTLAARNYGTTHRQGGRGTNGTVGAGACAPQLFDASDKQIAEQTASVRRRAEGNLGDLVTKLTASYDDNTKAVESMSTNIVAALGKIHDIVNMCVDQGHLSRQSGWIGRLVFVGGGLGC